MPPEMNRHGLLGDRSPHLPRSPGWFGAVERLSRSEDRKEGAVSVAARGDPVWKGRRAQPVEQGGTDAT